MEFLFFSREPSNLPKGRKVMLSKLTVYPNIFLSALRKKISSGDGPCSPLGVYARALLLVLLWCKTPCGNRSARKCSAAAE